VLGAPSTRDVRPGECPACSSSRVSSWASLTTPRHFPKPDTQKKKAASVCILIPPFFLFSELTFYFNMSHTALNLLRFATSSLRTPAVSRSYYHSHRTAAITSRTYSSTAPENAKETPEGSGDVQTKAKDKLDQVPPLSELEAKLQAKEAEVLDLTVRSSRRVITRLSFLTCYNFLGQATISPSRLLEPPAKRCS
jgi:hypothetical protein